MITPVNQVTKQRWIALGLLAVVIILLSYIIIIPSISKAMEFSEEKNELIFRLQRYQRTIDRKDGVLESYNAIKTEYDNRRYLTNQSTESLASAELQNAIKMAVVTTGGQLISTQVLPSKIEGEFKRISVKVRMMGTIEGLRSVLYQIETSVPLYVIDDMDIRPERGRRNIKTRLIEPSNKLMISFQASSFMSNKAP